jgi:hypothetical protein
MPEGGFVDVGLLGIIDDRVKRALRRPQRTGTFAERTGDVTAMVSDDDGSGTVIPVLAPADLAVLPGDRVVMSQFGSQWVVLASISPDHGVELQYEYTAAGETVTSASYVDAPGLPSSDLRLFTKTRMNTVLVARVDATAFSTVSSTDLRWGVLLTNVESGVTYGPTLISSWYSGTNDRTPHGRQVKLTGIPMGRYDAKLQWQRFAGTGVITMTADDRYSFNLRETTLQG